MKKNEKRGVIISVITIIMGVVGLVYTASVNESAENMAYMYSAGTTYVILGLSLLLYFIKLSKNKKRSDEQENIYLDERINSNKEKAFAISFKIIVWISLIADFMTIFFFRQYLDFSRILNTFICFSGFVYLIVYYFVSKNN